MNPHPSPHHPQLKVGRRHFADSLRSRLARSTYVVAIALPGIFAAGCATRYGFDVEAIQQSQPVLTEHSYRLVDARPDSGASARPFDRVAADVETALSGKGLYRAPEGIPPQLIIEIDYGISAPVVNERIHREPVYLVLGNSTMGSNLRPTNGRMGVAAEQRYMGDREIVTTVTTYEKFLRITARDPQSPMPGGGLRQVWSVLVTNEDTSRNLDAYTRLMIAAAMDNIGEHLPAERHIVLTKKDGRVTFVEKGAASS